MSKLLKKREGFTLIEIVLVLAIAGLILVIVFLAVTGAQRSQRDTARKDYVNRIAAGVVDQYGNNNSSWDCGAAASQTALGSINKPTLGAAGQPTFVVGADAGATDVVYFTAHSLTSCTIEMTLENGGTYNRTVTP